MCLISTYVILVLCSQQALQLVGQQIVVLAVISLTLSMVMYIMQQAQQAAHLTHSTLIQRRQKLELIVRTYANYKKTI
jgi:hypothetical protein